MYAVGNYTGSDRGRLMNQINGNDENYYFGATSGDFSVFFGSGSSWNDTAANTPAQDLSAAAVMGVVNSADVALPYFNGTVQNSKVGTMGAATGINIGRSVTTSQSWQGQAAEIVIVPTALDIDDRQKMEGYLAWEWEWKQIYLLITLTDMQHQRLMNHQVRAVLF